MKVSELIEELTALKEKEGDLRVYIEADHGQQTMASSWVGVSYIDDADIYMPQVIEEEELEEWDAVKIIQIQSC